MQEEVVESTELAQELAKLEPAVELEEAHTEVSQWKLKLELAADEIERRHVDAVDWPEAG